jgi:hypothetical protein
MTQPLDDLYAVSRNIHTRMNDRMAESPAGMSAEAIEIHWLIVLNEESDLSEEEAEESNCLSPDTYGAGYDQGWSDAVRMIVDARHLLNQAHPRLDFDSGPMLDPSFDFDSARFST